MPPIRQAEGDRKIAPPPTGESICVPFAPRSPLPDVSAPAPFPSSPAPAVSVRGLVKRYQQVEALRGIDLDVHRGEMFALLGPNGAGKTTLFSILATLRSPTAGSARVLGRDVVTERDAIRRDIGIVFQEPAIEQRLSGRDNLLLMGLFYGLKTSTARQRAERILADLGLTEAAGRPARTLSGGQRRKLELARALVTEPQILFLDEATLGLDVDARRGFWAQVRSLAEAGRTVFFTTHYMEEAEVADRIALIDQGRIAALDSPAALKARIGGGVIRMQTEDDRRSREWLGARGLKLETAGTDIMLVHPDPAALLPDLLRTLPVRVHRVSVEEPSLEDVFVTLTGRGLNGDGAGAAPQPRGGGG